MASTSITHHHALNTPNDHGPLVNTIAWLGIVISALAFVAHMVTKWIVKHRFDWDDGGIIAAVVAAIAQTIAVSSQMAQGLGKHAQQLSASQVDGFQRSLFASNILFISSLCFVKLSVTLIIRCLNPFQLNRKVCLAVGLGTLVWTVVSILLIALQCSRPDTWNFVDNTCVDRAGIWTFINIASIIIDALLIVMPIFILKELQVQLQRKLLIMSVFCCRILVVGSTLTLMVLTIRHTPTVDPSFEFTGIAIATTVTMNLSIMTACFPYLKPFLESLESGMIRSDDWFRRRCGTKKFYDRVFPLGLTFVSLTKETKRHTSNFSDIPGLTATSLPDYPPKCITIWLLHRMKA